jgi:ribose-phosphate pyrophosphokinase
MPFDRDGQGEPRPVPEIVLLTGNSNRGLAENIATYLKQDLTKATIKTFADGEIFAEIHENVRGRDVYVIQSTSRPANDNLMELLIMTDALRRASAKRITAVIPYFGYARQDRKPGPRTPISAKLVANLIETSGIDRVITVDLHAGQIQGFFDIPTDNLFAAPVIRRDIESRFKASDLVVVSPDVGGVVRARGLAKRIGTPIAICEKRRDEANKSEVMSVIGEVSGKRRRYTDQRCQRLARTRRNGGLCLSDTWRAVGRGGLKNRQLQAQAVGHHRQHQADRSRAGGQKHPHPADGQSARRGHRADGP